MSLNEKQLQAIPLLVQGMTGVEVAAALSVTPQTLSEWKKIPEYLCALNSAKQECLNFSLDRLRAATTIAADSLVDLIKNAESEEVRRKAIIDLFNLLRIEGPQKGLYGQGIGPIAMHAAEQTIKNESKTSLQALLGDLY